ncbi:phosphatidate cytidylyltransferase [Parasphingorhabdus cellanae]|uniref:Phosphatidate cytidylyltransferase n=1 Tax=Parasphingorhabdus cellanae TaxID=2806553 RepID=A0ABX7T2Z2_9SPHN|nr:phosphatidate cytidylyltransferase [Parasphingorhabdus cellanae]QTD55926.1 phosphatidate cytidylyltransferase [Parasphingorhabdus cellanae]
MSDPKSPAQKHSNELLTRVIVGVALVATTITTLIVGDHDIGRHALWLLVVLMSLGILWEWAGLTGRVENRRLAQYALSVPLAIMSYLAAGPSFLALGMILGAAMFIAAFDRSYKLAIGILYAGLPALSILYLRGTENGLLIVFWTLALVWATDIGAYFSGRAIGGPKLAPRFSPNKTWAGLIGGVIVTGLFSFILHIYFQLPFQLVLLSLPLAVLAQMGDLFESQMKRRAGVKDSGTVFPGHGGVMDRLDGLIPVAPVVAVIVLAGSQ